MGYVGSVTFVVVGLVLVGDAVLAVALGLIETLMVTAVHLARRHSDRPADDPGEPSSEAPWVPVLDRVGHDPAGRRTVGLVLGALIGSIVLIAVIIVIANALGP